jgi:acetyl esterase
MLLPSFPVEELDAGMAAFNDILSKGTPPEAVGWPLEKQRVAWDEVCRGFRKPRPAGLQVTDMVAKGVPLRLFKPATADIVPGIIYAHGGGWVLGSPETHDDICAEMAAGANCAVALFNYRKAPEHPFPAQLEDSLKVWRWLKEEGAALGIDPSRLIAAGDSCGGQMSAALALALRDLNMEMPKGLVLIYPALGADFSLPSYIRNANAPSLSRADMDFYLRSFLGPAGGTAWTDPLALPNLAQDLSGLPPVAMTAAAHDPLHDEAVIFMQKLQAAQTPVHFRSEPKLAHSYMRARNHSKPALESFNWIIEQLRSFAHI